MLYIVLSFLMIALVLYVLLAGADFGAGIVELFSSKQHQALTKKTVYRVIGPVWEANHIWIIIIVVILWVGFPKFYNVLVIYLHVPLTLILLGITLRGVSFVFRHYDAFKDRSQIIYDWMFRISSFVTPIFLGTTFGAMVSGTIRFIETPAQSLSFFDLFIASWLNPFSISIGLFFTALCAFLATVLLIGEAHKTERSLYVKRAKISTVIVILVGCIVLSYGYFNKSVFVLKFLNNPYAVGLVVLSAILIVPLGRSITNAKKVKSRFFAGIQVILILVAAVIAHYPNVLIAAETTMSITNTASPPKVINTLAISLIIGAAVILPGLYHLFKSFKMIKILDT